LDYIKLGLFKFLRKITEVNYKLNLSVKMKIYLVYKEYKLLLYKVDIYRGHKEDK
jgi:hypothetical protein